MFKNDPSLDIRLDEIPRLKIGGVRGRNNSFATNIDGNSDYDDGSNVGDDRNVETKNKMNNSSLRSFISQKQREDGDGGVSSVSDDKRVGGGQGGRGGKRFSSTYKMSSYSSSLKGVRKAWGNSSNEDEEDVKRERRLYCRENLNEQQRVLFDYMTSSSDASTTTTTTSNKNKTTKNATNRKILVQAGPGTGKTFTMMTLAHYWRRRKGLPVTVVIYKHDLLQGFKNCAQLCTVARFFMEMLGLSFFAYTSLEQQLCARMSSREFIRCICELLRKAVLPSTLKRPGCLLILDEYTVIPKPLLFVLLCLLELNDIPVVVCGDKNQLPNIHNSSHTVCSSSYDIARAVVERVFRLSVNVRCADPEYNEIIDYVARFSCDRRVDRFAVALVSALFYPNFNEFPNLRETHLAATHQELTNTQYMMILNNAVPVSYYYIDVSNVRVPLSRVCGTPMNNGLYQPHAMRRFLATAEPGKFLPYLALVVGNRYFVKTYSEHSQAVLISINLTDRANSAAAAAAVVSNNNDNVFAAAAAAPLLIQEDDIYSVTVRYDDGQTETLTRAACNDVVFEQHRKYLLCSDEAGEVKFGAGGVGKLYNFPIYPSNYMSVHMCQGRTIKDRVDMSINETTYQGLYVLISRVTTPRQISRVVIPNMISHAVSTLINFPELCSQIPTTTTVTTTAVAPDGNRGVVVVGTKEEERRPLLSVATLKERFAGNRYVHYELKCLNLCNQLHPLVSTFVRSRDVRERSMLRDVILKRVAGATCDQIRLHLVNSPDWEVKTTTTTTKKKKKNTKKTNDDNDDANDKMRSYEKEEEEEEEEDESFVEITNASNNVTAAVSPTMKSILKCKNIILALSTIEETDAEVWLYEYMRRDNEMNLLNIHNQEEEELQQQQQQRQRAAIENDIHFSAASSSASTYLTSSKCATLKNLTGHDKRIDDSRRYRQNHDDDDDDGGETEENYDESNDRDYYIKEYIKTRAVPTSKKHDNGEATSSRQYFIEDYVGTGLVLETSRFKWMVYNILNRSKRSVDKLLVDDDDDEGNDDYDYIPKAITTRWLLKQLKYMLRRVKEDDHRLKEPEKLKKKKDESRSFVASTNFLNKKRKLISSSRIACATSSPTTSSSITTKSKDAKSTSDLLGLK